jgi:outer membrane protein assembly factor BamB
MLYCGGYEAGLTGEKLSSIPDDLLYPEQAWDYRTWWVRPVYSYYVTQTSEPVVGTDGTVFLGIQNYYDPTFIVAYNGADGSPAWTLEDPAGLRGDGMWGELALDYAGNIYAADYKSLFSFAPNGSVNWTFDYPTNNSSVASNGSWGFKYAAPVVGADSTVYVNSDLGQLFALEGTNGSLKWVTPLQSGAANGLLNGCSPAIGFGGALFYGASNYFFAVNPSDGSYLWTFRPGRTDEVFMFSPVVGGDGTVFAHSWSPGTNRLYALNPSNGVPKWTSVLRATNHLTDLPSLWYRGTLALAADGEIYVADTDAKIYSFAPNGSTNWTYVNPDFGLVDNAFYSSLLICPDGTLFVGSAGIENICLSGPAPLACAPWPEYRKNGRRTAAVAPPSAGAHLSSLAMTPGGFQFTVEAATNSTECICASRNLVTWTNLGQIVLTNGPANFLDTGASNYQYRFYRAFPQ